MAGEVPPWFGAVDPWLVIADTTEDEAIVRYLTATAWKRAIADASARGLSRARLVDALVHLSAEAFAGRRLTAI